MAKAQKRPTDMSEIAERLRITREASGLKQAAWCRLTGVSAPAWNNYEAGNRRISIDEALKVCAAVGVTLDWIYRGQAAGLPMNYATEIQRLRNSPAARRSA